MANILGNFDARKEIAAHWEKELPISGITVTIQDLILHFGASADMRDTLVGPIRKSLSYEQQEDMLAAIREMADWEWMQEESRRTVITWLLDEWDRLVKPGKWGPA